MKPFCCRNSATALLRDRMAISVMSSLSSTMYVPSFPASKVNLQLLLHSLVSAGVRHVPLIVSMSLISHLTIETQDSIMCD